MGSKRQQSQCPMQLAFAFEGWGGTPEDEGEGTELPAAKSDPQSQAPAMRTP